jgi:hypothetical protein
MFIRAFMIYEAVGLVVGACGLCGLHHDFPSTFAAPAAGEFGMRRAQVERLALNWLRSIFVGRHRIGWRPGKRERQTTACRFRRHVCFESRRARASHTVTRRQPIWSNMPDIT